MTHTRCSPAEEKAQGAPTVELFRRQEIEEGKHHTQTRKQRFSLSHTRAHREKSGGEIGKRPGEGDNALCRVFERVCRRKAQLRTDGAQAYSLDPSAAHPDRQKVAQLMDGARQSGPREHAVRIEIPQKGGKKKETARYLELSERHP